MSQMIGTITLFPGSFVPVGYIACNGQALPIMKNQILYTIISNKFGGNVTTFNVPKLTPPQGMSYLLCVDGEYPERPQ
jgi:microcystin-dependent protein